MALATPTTTEVWLLRLRRHLDSFAPAGLTLALASTVLLLGWRGVDQAAQTYRVLQYQVHGLMLWDSGWYAGNFPLGYSVLFPPVAALLGLRVVAIASAVVATWAFDRFVRAHLGARPLGTWYFAVSTILPVTIGQWPFLAGEAAGLSALVCLHRGRRPWALALGVLAALFSPLAAAFLAMVCLAWSAFDRTGRRAIFATAALALVVVLALGLMFPGTGPFPFPWTGLVVTELLCLTALTPLVQTTAAVRTGALLYGVATLVSFLVPNPLGGNAPRLAATIGVPLLACFVTAPGSALSSLSHSSIVSWLARGRRILIPHRWRYAAAVVVVPFAVWQWAPWDGVITAPSRAPYTSQSFYNPLVTELHRLSTWPVRVEVVPTLDHWESAFVAPEVPLARGWERQLDIADNPLFYSQTPLTAATYESWLRSEGVTYVALPAAPLDYAARSEGALLSSGVVGDLRPVWASAQWKVWQVTDSPGLVSGPAQLTSLEPDHFVLRFSRAGTATVRVRYTRFWSVSSGQACAGPIPATTSSGANPYLWTAVDALAPGTVDISASVLHPSPAPTCPTG